MVKDVQKWILNVVVLAILEILEKCNLSTSHEVKIHFSTQIIAKSEISQKVVVHFLHPETWKMNSTNQLLENEKWKRVQ